MVEASSDFSFRLGEFEEMFETVVKKTWQKGSEKRKADGVGAAM